MITRAVRPLHGDRAPASRWLAMLVLLVPTVLEAGTGIIVANGIGGEESWREAFAAQRERIAGALRSLEDEGEDGGALVLFDGEHESGDSLLASIERVGDAAEALFVLVLLGHGSQDPDGWHFNVSGPDIDAEALAAALAGVRAPRQVVIVSTSASGALLETLAQPGRVLVTATKSGAESNAVRFSEQLAEVLDTASADRDRNEILTVAEAFRAARERTAAWYETRELLASEHARLVGEDAAELPLAYLGALARARSDPRVAALLETRLSLEDSLDALRARKPRLDTETYYGELETLMLAIARLQQVIDRVTDYREDRDA